MNPSAKNNDEQRKDEWENLDRDGLKYHTAQWETPKRSTLAFEQFIKPALSKAKNVIDMGAGAGAATAYIASQNNSVHFTGFDYSAQLVKLGNQITANKKIENLDFEQGDWYNLNLTKTYDGCISLQTLSWLPDYEAPMAEIFQKINPDFVAVTSLFYEGDITCRIEVNEHSRNDLKGFYNIYSLPAVGRFCAKHGYRLKTYVPFEIDIDIEKPSNVNVMGTYTEGIVDKKTGQQRRIQISGPLLMSWYMLLIEKIR